MLGKKNYSSGNINAYHSELKNQSYVYLWRVINPLLIHTYGDAGVEYSTR